MAEFTRIRKANYAKELNPNELLIKLYLSMRLDDAPTKSPITSIYSTTTLVWYLWLHRVGPKKWHFAYAEDFRDTAQLRSHFESILSIRLDDAPTKSPITSIYSTTTLVWYLCLHRVGPKKWHFEIGRAHV